MWSLVGHGNLRGNPLLPNRRKGRLRRRLRGLLRRRGSRDREPRPRFDTGMEYLERQGGVPLRGARGLRPARVVVVRWRSCPLAGRRRGREHRRSPVGRGERPGDEGFSRRGGHPLRGPFTRRTPRHHRRLGRLRAPVGGRKRAGDPASRRTRARGHLRRVGSGREAGHLGRGRRGTPTLGRARGHESLRSKATTFANGLSFWPDRWSSRPMQRWQRGGGPAGRRNGTPRPAPRRPLERGPQDEPRAPSPPTAAGRSPAEAGAPGGRKTTRSDCGTWGADASCAASGGTATGCWT